MGRAKGKIAESGIEPKRGPRWRELASYPGELCLDDAAQRAWRFLIPRLIRMGILEKDEGIDAMALVVFCREWSVYSDLTADVETNGGTYEVETEFGPLQKQRPAAVLQDKAFKRIRAMISELGLSPAARKRIVLAGEEKEDPLAKFLTS